MAAPQSSSSAAATAQAPTKIAVMTSGGDSAGMNAAVRSVVKMAIFKGCHAYVIREGWEGLVRGNDEDQGSNPTPHQESLDAGPESLAQPRSAGKAGKVKFVPTYGEGELLKEGVSEAETVGLKGRYIVRVGWDDVRGWLDAGGTLIGTARCAAFREQAGRLKAAHNLIKHGIDALAVCGGDGSLTGADRLRAEWPELIGMLKDNGESKTLCKCLRRFLLSTTKYLSLGRRHYSGAVRKVCSPQDRGSCRLNRQRSGRNRSHHWSSYCTLEDLRSR